MTEGTGSPNFIELAADIVSAYVSKNSLPSTELPALINSVHGTLRRSPPVRSRRLRSR